MGFTIRNASRTPGHDAKGRHTLALFPQAPPATINWLRSAGESVSVPPLLAGTQATQWYAGVVAGQADVSAVLAAERAATLERLEGLEREFAGIVEAAGPAGADDEHDPEGATIAFERQHVAALASQVRGHLAQIEAAMRRLAQGRYGICQDCARPIPAARLAARPASTTCLSCATHR